MKNENEPGVNAWKVLALSLTVVLAAMIGVIFVVREGGLALTGNDTQSTKEASSAAPESDESVAEAGPETDAASASSAETGESAASADASTADTEEQTYDVRITFADGFQYTRVEGTTVYLMEGKNNPAGEPVRTLKTDELGRAITTLPAGEYTLVWGDEIYYDGMDHITIGGPDGAGVDFCSDIDNSGSAYIFWKYILPRQTGNTLCLVLEWKGSLDLDLCVFNATEKRYISMLSPEDGSGCYLVDDDAEGSPGWEVVVIRDYTKSDVYTPYIRDGDSLIHASLSAMEANGVRFSVLDHNGLLFSQEADPEERAPLWMPCYIYNGKVMTDSVYEYDPARYAWAAYTK